MMNQCGAFKPSDDRITEADLAQWFENPWWPLGLALGWLVWRNSHKAVCCLMDSTRDPKSIEGEDSIEGQQMSFIVARTRLLNAAHAGEVATIGKPVTGESRITIHSQEWDSLHLQVTSLFSMLSHLEFDFQTDKLNSWVQYTDIGFARADVIARWPVTKEALSQALTQEGLSFGEEEGGAGAFSTDKPKFDPLRNKGGRPAQYDGVGFLIEAFRLMYESSRVPTAAEHRRLALDAFSAKSNQQPSDEWAKLHIRRLRAELDLNKP